MQIPVHAFTTAYNRRVNVLTSEVLISEAFHPSSASKHPTPIKFTAIWDTGATNTVITQKVIDDCGLRPISMAKVNTAKGEMNTPVYLANIVLPNRVGIHHLRMTKGEIIGDAEVLIGMDIISQGDFAVTNKEEKTVFSFRVPSVECIDFVKQKPSVAAPQISKPSPKVGRNDPCPCGSGKKYKKCCGK